jgi:hypothetical protein
MHAGRRLLLFIARGTKEKRKGGDRGFYIHSALYKESETSEMT